MRSVVSWRDDVGGGQGNIVAARLFERVCEVFGVEGKGANGQKQPKRFAHDTGR